MSAIVKTRPSAAVEFLDGAQPVKRNSMSRETDAAMEAYGWQKVATGTWFYDKTVPMEIAIWAKPAHLASSRFDEDDKLIESRPIPETKDGFLYFCSPGRSSEYLTVARGKGGGGRKALGAH
jgi:hypothetical protein